MNDHERRRKLNRVELIAGKSNTVLANVVAALLEARQGQPGAQSYDSPGGGGTLWCWLHEREVAMCHRADLDCDGESIEVADPTGEAAVTASMGQDLAASDERRLDRIITDLDNRAGELKQIFDRWLPLAPRAQERLKEAHRRHVTSGNESCELCAKAGFYSQPHVTASDCKGNLERNYRLCSFCWRFVLDTGAKPSDAQLRDHHQGRRVRRAVS